VNKTKDKSVKIMKLPPFISIRLSKEVLEKSKFFKKENKLVVMVKLKSYAQVTNLKVFNILKIKEVYPNLLANKIENIHKIINNSSKTKPKINMATRKPSHKQIIIFVSKNNITKFMAFFSKHIANLNRALRALKGIKSDIRTYYVCSEHTDITIATNKVALVLDLKVIENYVKNIENINSKDIKIP